MQSLIAPQFILQYIQTTVSRFSISKFFEIPVFFHYFYYFFKLSFYTVQKRIDLSTCHGHLTFNGNLNKIL